MRLQLLAVSAVLLGVAGCASNDEWDTWKQRPSHFASTDHMMFSFRNQGPAAARVTRRDITVARNEGWWGRPVTVSQEQILER